MRTVSESKLVHGCMQRARTPEGLAEEFGYQPADVLTVLERLVAKGRLRLVTRGVRTGYRTVPKPSSATTAMRQRRETNAQRMSNLVAAVGARERVRNALAAEPLTAPQLEERFGPDGVTAADWLLTHGEVRLGDDGNYRRVPQPATGRARRRPRIARPAEGLAA